MNMKNALATVLVLGSMLMPVAAFADNPKNPTDLKGHPRVNQVNQRVQNQHERIEQGVKNGTISKQQATQLHKERADIKTEEHAMRKADGGHLTKGDQKVLNQQMNARSKQIYQEKHPK